MKFKTKKIVTMAFFLSLISCGEKVFIDKEDLAAINIYSVGDTLIFQNIITKKLDTNIITKKEIYHPNYDWLRHDGYQPHYASIYYYNKKLKYGEEKMMSAGKKKPNENYIGVTYLYSTFFLCELTDSDVKFYNVEKHDLKTLHTIVLESFPKTFSKVIILSNGKHRKHSSKDDYKPQTLFWDKVHGIIKYRTFSGEVWERINWN